MLAKVAAKMHQVVVVSHEQLRLSPDDHGDLVVEQVLVRVLVARPHAVHPAPLHQRHLFPVGGVQLRLQTI